MLCRRQAATMSAGYQPFNGNDNNHSIQEIADDNQRLSNAPQVVIVSDINNAASNPASSIAPNSSSSIYSGGIAPNALSQPIMSNYDAPLIRNAV